MKIVTSLSEKYPDLYPAAEEPHVTIGEAKMTLSNGAFLWWNMNINFSSLVNEARVQLRAQDLMAIQEAEGEDVLAWRWSSTGRFSSSSWYRVLNYRGLTVPLYAFLWRLKLPPKIAVFGWIRIQRRLLTRDRLARWNIVNDDSCVLCVDGKESHSHLLGAALTVASTLNFLRRE